MSRLHTLLLCGILLLALFLRIYNFENVPPSAALDEASVGYNAYSILKTGADEYGTKFPILLRAYDDWRPALYVYLVVPFVKLFGPGILAVRLPSMILSVVAVLATYFLAHELVSPWVKKKAHAGVIGLAAAALLAISPWHIYTSRTGHEVNAGAALFVFGTLFFLLGLKKKQKLPFFMTSSIAFALSFFSYQSEKVIIPLFLLVLCFVFRERLRGMKKEIVISGIVGIILLVPVFVALFSPHAFIRLKGTTVFYELNPVYAEHAKLFVAAKEEGNLIGQVFHHSKAVSVQIFAGSYLSHFNPLWLFGNLKHDRHKIPDMGLFYLWEISLLLAGLFALFKEKQNKQLLAILIGWILISPLPAAITTDAPHATRIFTLLPAPQIIAAVGLLYLWEKIPRGISRKIAIGVFVVVVLTSLSFMYKQYFEVFPKKESQSFQFALAESLPYVLAQEHEYENIVVSNRLALYQSYMYYLFYSKLDPLAYQKLGGTVSGGYEENHTIGKFTFRPIDWKNEDKENTLYVGNPVDFPDGLIPEFYGKYKDGTIGVVVIDPARLENREIERILQLNYASM